MAPEMWPVFPMGNAAGMTLAVKPKAPVGQPHPGLAYSGVTLGTRTG